MSNNWFQQIFGKKQPIQVHEVLHRSAGYIERYNSWKEMVDQQKIWNVLYHDIKAHLTATGGTGNVLYTAYKGSHALAVFNSAQEEIDHWKFRLDYLFEKAKVLGYRAQNNTLHMEEQKEDVITRELYYLKPPIAFEKPKDQYWGNLKLELRLKNNQMDYLKIQTTYYNDFNFLQPRSFPELIDQLFL